MLERWFYPPPKPEHRLDAVPNAGGNPASDPATLRRHVLADGDADAAVLIPQTRGLLPDLDLGTAVCSAINRWLAECWLTDEPGIDGKLLGTIRVNAGDPDGATREIEMWAGHERMVQVAVTMQSHAPYGHRRFHPIWETAARYGLPVAILGDMANAVEFKPTYAGYPTHFLEFAAQAPLNFIYHLLSLLTEGVFDRFEDLVVVFPDGGADLAIPLLWRFDKDWRPGHIELPWMRERPMTRLRRNVRFCLTGFEGPTGPDEFARWLRIEHPEAFLMWASHYPSIRSPAESDLATMPDDVADSILLGNAMSLYGERRLAG
jgi:uncharacterized protein